jgi:hypothetical protein
MAGTLALPRLAPRRDALPGFGLTLGVTLLWLSVIVLGLKRAE